jgi:60 kDa SS-A/Ro ribonucleoprotein
MAKNEAGGYVFPISDFKRLRRFLILGTEGGTYYQNEKALTLENAQAILRCVKANGIAVVDELVKVSDEGLAVKNDAAIFVLAMVTKFGDPAARKYAYDHLPKVCRIGTHLFQFAEFRQGFGGGWGRGARQAVGNWYRHRNAPALVNQALKYQQRNGWSHRDLLRLAHPKPLADGQKEVFDAICRPEKWSEVKVSAAEAFVKLRTVKTAAEAAKIIADYGVPREFVPTEFLNSVEVWDALLPTMPMTAMIRNLGNMSKVGLLVPLSEATKVVTSRLTDADAIKSARVHPFNVLLAAKTYGQGKGFKGKGEWAVVPQVMTALDKTFDLAFKNVEPTGKKHLLAVDVSSSMSWAQGGGPISAAEAAAAMSLITARVESDYYIMGFSTTFKDLGITASDSLKTVMAKTTKQNFGGTDTSVAVKWAMAKNVKPDVIVVYTDNATWAGDTHTFKAMKMLRDKTGHPVKLAVVAFTSTGYSIAKQDDQLSMDFVGLDSSLPQALSMFVME